MKFNPHIHKRSSLRLKGYDYSNSGLYFITICCQGKFCYFRKIENELMLLNDPGKMILDCWLTLRTGFENINLLEFIIIPNHFHGIIEILNNPYVADNSIVSKETKEIFKIINKPKTLGDIIGSFKSKTTLQYIRGVKLLAWEPFDGLLWQRNFYEHIIRNKKSYEFISNYILNNPSSWKEDIFYKDDM
ncbi:MAG TPA: hypothetical protein VK590_14895 [Saprospiraceae bacterium]|nr:hypothetical protein [Saprospiraceae bacterium]